MNKVYDKMKFIDYINPMLKSGEYEVSITQKVTSPQKEVVTEKEGFYVATRAYTLDVESVFSVSPTENECGDFSKLIPFITLKNRTYPWDYKTKEDINGVPAPWVALIVISFNEKVKEADIAIADLLSKTPKNIYFPQKSDLPQEVTESSMDLCHIIDMPKELYNSIIPTAEEMTYLVHARRINLADTEDNISALDGDFSVIMANRFIPTGENKLLKSTVHLVSMLGMPDKISDGYDMVRLVSLHRFNTFSIKDNSEGFTQIIENLSKNTGIIGYDQENEILKRGYVPKKHYVRTGEVTYSLYRSPLIPYKNKEMDFKLKNTADGHLIYDSTFGVFDTSYASAFQIGRLISLSQRANSKMITTFRKKQKIKAHKKMLSENMQKPDIAELFKNMI